MKSNNIRNSPISIVQGDTSISSADFNVIVNQFRYELLNSGVKEQQVIAVKGENSIDFIIAMYAVMAAGAIALPVYHLSGKDEWQEMLKKANVAWAIFQNKFIPQESKLKILDVEKYTFGLEKFESSVDAALLHSKGELEGVSNKKFHNRESPPRFIRFTSGTTGAAKGVLLSERSIEERIEAANKTLNLGPNDTVLWVLPMAFHFVVSIMLYVRFGVKIVIANSNLPSDLLTLAETHQATFLYLSPLHIKFFASAKVENFPKSIKTVISTSAGANTEDCKKFFQLYGIPVSQAYGIIELGLPIINLNDAEHFPNSAGKATPGYEVGILDENLNPLSFGKQGKLAIKGVGMFEAYLAPWKPKNDVLQNGWFLTGDIAETDSEGRVFIKGREKSMINLSGLKVFPEEVEAVINQIKGVETCRVYGVTDSKMQETLEAEVVISDKTTLTESDIKQTCRMHLAMYKIPTKIYFVETITETQSGKVKRG